MNRLFFFDQVDTIGQYAWFVGMKLEALGKKLLSFRKILALTCECSKILKKYRSFLASSEGCRVEFPSNINIAFGVRFQSPFELLCSGQRC